MTEKPTVVILAAGIGSRYGGLKQIEPVGPDGEIILDYTLFDAWRAGFGRAVFVIQPEHEALLKERFHIRLAGRLDTAFVHQRLDDLPRDFTPPPKRKKPWGTGHAVRAARRSVSGWFAVANADDFYGRGSWAALGCYLAAGHREKEWCLVTFRLANTLSAHGPVSRGICEIDSAGQLLSIVERTRIERAGPAASFIDGKGEDHDLSGREQVSMNLWGFSPRLFGYLESGFAGFLTAPGGAPKAEFQLPTLVDRLLARGECRCRALPSEERWFGMTYREDRDQVRAEISRLVRAGVYPERLWD